MRLLLITLAMPLLVAIDQYQFNGYYGAQLGLWIVRAFK
jgi:hypothetical protein